MDFEKNKYEVWIYHPLHWLPH